jgi:hypothetical protein
MIEPNRENRMRKLAIGLAVLGLTAVLQGAAINIARAQGQGGYAPGCPGAETVRMTSDERIRARAAHQTNDTSGGRSSIDKSCKTWEGGNTIEGPQPGSIGYGFGGAHTGHR